MNVFQHIADNRVTSGKEVTSAKKVSSFQGEHGCFFIMASGLRSVRDKVMTYFNESEQSGENGAEKLFQVVNCLTQQIRRVAEEDKKSLLESGLPFDIHCLVGGQMKADKVHGLYLVYPEGNWVEVGKGASQFHCGMMNRVDFYVFDLT